MRTTREIVESKQQQRWFRAVRKANELTPIFTSVARAMSGNPTLRLEWTNVQSATDGKTVWLVVPVELGDTIEHDRALCSRRDHDSHPMCPACMQMQMVHRPLFHELAHIIQGSFQEIEEADKVDLMAKVLAENPAYPGSRLAKLQQIVDTAKAGEANYMGIAQHVSQFLPAVINALEDARVNRAMYEVRAGTYHMFRSGIIDTLERGCENADGTVFHWHNEDENAQIIIGLLANASGVDPREGWFSDAVLEALKDEALTADVDALKVGTPSAADIYRASFSILEHLRRLGFCRRQDDPEDQMPQPGGDNEQENEPSPGEESDSQDSVPGSATGDENDDQQRSDDDSSSDGESDSGGSSEPDDVPDNDDSDAGGGKSDETDRKEPESEAGSESSSENGQDQDDDESEAAGGSDDMDGKSSDNSDAGSELTEQESSPSNGAGQNDAAQERMNASDPENVIKLIKIFGGHEHDDQPRNRNVERELGAALIQAEQFDEVSTTVAQFNVHHHESPTERTKSMGWAYLDNGEFDEYSDACTAEASEFQVSESIVGPTLLKLRTIFADNKKAKYSGELRSGRIVSHRLASVATGNVRVFNKRSIPSKKDYFVQVALDISGSTQGERLINIKKLGMTLGNLLQRAGVKFAIDAHSGNSVRDNRNYGYEGDIFVVKAEHEPWDTVAQNRLAKLNDCGCNLDGHALEYFRKRCDRSSATDKVILYVTDGNMPEANSYDEKEVLVREIKECAKRGYSLVGVGISTDSPKQYGLDTIRINRPEDIALLVTELEKRLAVRI